MSGYRYRGTVTRNLYTFNSPLLDNNGHQVTGGQYSTAFYNGFLYPQGEIVIVANNDGSVAMPVAGPGQLEPSSQENIGNISLPTVTASPWENVFVSGPTEIEGPTLPSGLPIFL